MIVKRRAFFLLAGMALGVSLTSAPAFAADMDAMVTKAPPYAVAPVAVGPQTCNSVGGFFLTDCQLLWGTVRLYGTLDMGGTYRPMARRLIRTSRPARATCLARAAQVRPTAHRDLVSALTA